MYLFKADHYQALKISSDRHLEQQSSVDCFVLVENKVNVCYKSLDRFSSWSSDSSGIFPVFYNKLPEHNIYVFCC